MRASRAKEWKSFLANFVYEVFEKIELKKKLEIINYHLVLTPLQDLLFDAFFIKGIPFHDNYWDSLHIRNSVGLSPLLIGARTTPDDEIIWVFLRDYLSKNKDDQIVIYCRNKKYLELLTERLWKYGKTSQYFTKMNKLKCFTAIKNFENKDARFLLCDAIKDNDHLLKFDHANTVILLDPKAYFHSYYLDDDGSEYPTLKRRIIHKLNISKRNAKESCKLINLLIQKDFDNLEKANLTFKEKEAFLEYLHERIKKYRSIKNTYAIQICLSWFIFLIDQNNVMNNLEFYLFTNTDIDYKESCYGLSLQTKYLKNWTDENNKLNCFVESIAYSERFFDYSNYYVTNYLRSVLNPKQKIDSTNKQEDDSSFLYETHSELTDDILYETKQIYWNPSDSQKRQEDDFNPPKVTLKDLDKMFLNFMIKKITG
ncbi:rhodanese-like domain-containing protein [[Mycoplasma] testudinis]|uniref:hypothetical protein n=1 Tax=[Mycoplasma] testudinis TaxID=33924 RepID=UPI000483B6EB|nr:hypothetical protein [[Mycoplasma] testudinis]